MGRSAGAQSRNNGGGNAIGTGTARPPPQKPQQSGSAAAAGRASETRLIIEMFNSDEYVKKKVLIEEVKKRPYLFKKNDPAYSDKMKVHRGWLDVSGAVGWDEETCRAKWRNIRDGYRKIQRYRMKHPEDTTFVNKHPELSFLDLVPFRPRSSKSLTAGQYYLRSDTGSFESQQLVEIVQQHPQDSGNGDTPDDVTTVISTEEILPPATTTSTMSDQPVVGQSQPVIVSRTLTTTSSAGQQCPLILIDNSSPSTATGINSAAVSGGKRRQQTSTANTTSGVADSAGPSATKIYKIAAPMAAPPSKETLMVMQILQDVQRRCSELAVLVQKHPKVNNVFMTLSNMIEDLPMERRAAVYGKIFELVSDELKQNQGTECTNNDAAINSSGKTTGNGAKNKTSDSGDNDHSSNMDDNEIVNVPVVKVEQASQQEDDNDDSLFSS